jgi:hypothetical protein
MIAHCISDGRHGCPGVDVATVIEVGDDNVSGLVVTEVAARDDTTGRAVKSISVVILPTSWRTIGSPITTRMSPRLLTFCLSRRKRRRRR